MNKNLLNQVEKPSRYLGGESGSFKKNPTEVDLRFCLAFPDVYEIGMSHQGHQILYSVLNQRPDIFAERAYAPWVDAMDLLRNESQPLTSLETGTALSQFDAIGFTLAYELASTNVLAMLDLGGVPLTTDQRSDADPIVIAGGPVALNPQPLSMFIDAFYLGDGEEGALDLADALIQTKGKPRKKRLERLAAIDGVYVPEHPAEKTPKRRILPDLNSFDFAGPILVPNARPVHERLAVEIARGCTRGCRFCQAGYIYRPVRERSPEKIARMIDQGLAQSGFDDLSLLSLSAGDYSCISPLISSIIEAKLPQRISVSLPSLRIESLTPEIMEQIRKIKRTGFTIAPEAGSEKLRFMLNKKITDAELLDTVSQVFANGWDLVKLYFMIGLPGETLSDVDAIVSLIHQALEQGRRQNKRARINVNVATYVPKPHTPFQWESQLTLEEARRRLDRIKGKLLRGKINLKWQNVELSLLEGAIARGNRETGKAILAAYRSGCRYDAWDEHFDLAKWEKAFLDSGMDLHKETARVFSKEAPLPWDAVDVGVTRDYLLSELDKAYEEEITGDCRVDACLDCGVCGDIIDVQTTQKELNASLFATEETKQVPSATFRFRLKYSKTGTSKFLGHLELSAAFQRAFRRANLPLAYSQGYSPAPKVAFGPPLPVGVESNEEYVDILLIQRLDPKQLFEVLSPEFFPDGILLTACETVPLKEPSLFVQTTGAKYEIVFSPECMSPESIQEKIDRFQNSESFCINIMKKKKIRTIDLTPLVPTLEQVDKAKVKIELLMPSTGGVGIVPSIKHIFNLEQIDINGLLICKKAVTLSLKNNK